MENNKEEVKVEIKDGFRKKFKPGFVEEMKIIQKKNALSNKDLAKITGKTEAQISKILNPDKIDLPGLDFIVKLKETYYESLDLNFLLFPKERERIETPTASSTEFATQIKTVKENDWRKPLFPGEYRYIKEDLNSGKDINRYLSDLEEVEGRLYISNIFPSGFHRPKDNDEVEIKRKKVLSQPDKRNIEIYTIAAFLNFGFGKISERIYSYSEKIRILTHAEKYFNQSVGEKAIHFIDASNKKEKNEEGFYGFSITRILNKDHVVTTEPNRTFRIERNEKRYKEIKKEFETPNHRWISGTYLIKLMQEILENKEKSKEDPLQRFLKSIENAEIKKLCEANVQKLD